jgi:hypothetical protein
VGGEGIPADLLAGVLVVGSVDRLVHSLIEQIVKLGLFSISYAIKSFCAD